MHEYRSDSHPLPVADPNPVADPTGWSAVLEGFRAGDPAAFETLSTVVTHILKSYSGWTRLGPADADDLAGETVLRVWAGRSTFTGDIHGFRAWVRTLADLQWKTLRNRRSRQRRRGETDDGLEEQGRFDDPADDLAREAQWRFLLAMVPKLSALQQLVVLLRLHDHDWASIAWICAHNEGGPVSVEAVQRRCQHAIDKLRAWREPGA